MVASETAFPDEDKMEYHWKWASGTSTVLDKEYVLDLVEWKWFELDRTTNLKLQLGISVASTTGNKYTYGFIDTGYMERLEYGTSFDGQPIVSTLDFGTQLMIPGDMLSQTSITRANLVSVAKATDTSVTLTHTIDEATSGTDYTLSMADATHRVANDIVDVFSKTGVFHSFKLVTSSIVEVLGFQPLLMALYYQKERDRKG
jgi:hypothetical protein